MTLDQMNGVSAPSETIIISDGTLDPMPVGGTFQAGSTKVYVGAVRLFAKTDDRDTGEASYVYDFWHYEETGGNTTITPRFLIPAGEAVTVEWSP